MQTRAILRSSIAAQMSNLQRSGRHQDDLMAQERATVRSASVARFSSYLVGSDESRRRQCARMHFARTAALLSARLQGVADFFPIRRLSILSKLASPGRAWRLRNEIALWKGQELQRQNPAVRISKWQTRGERPEGDSLRGTPGGK